MKVLNNVHFATLYHLPLFVEESSHVATLLWFRNIAHSEEKLCFCEVVALASASQKILIQFSNTTFCILIFASLVGVQYSLIKQIKVYSSLYFVICSFL